MDWADPQLWVGLVTLTVLEIVLGIDNIVFISILSAKLPAEQQARARQVGLSLAMFMRILLLLSLSWVMGLTRPLLPPEAAFGLRISGRDLVLFLGGLFLIWKSTSEIHQKLEGEEGEVSARVAPSFSGVITEILLLDIVFSLGSVITAVGMVREIPVMVAAVVLAVLFMLVFAGSLSEFIQRHPTLKMLALAFLVLVGANLIAESFHQEIPKGYTYFAMAFSVAVEMLNLRLRGRAVEPVHLRQPITAFPPVPH